MSAFDPKRTLLSASHFLADLGGQLNLFSMLVRREDCLAPALVREVQPLRGASTNQPSLPAYARALTNWPPSNPISKAFFSIHAFVLGARVSIPASANACSSRIASARSIGRFAISAVKTPQSTFRDKTSARSISPRLLMNSTMASVSSLSTVPP